MKGKLDFMPINDRAFYLKYAEALKHPGDFSSRVTDFFANDADINIVHPFNQLNGSNAYLEEFLIPLQESFNGLYRRDDIFMLGKFEGQKWISSTGYYVGHFAKDWIGLRAAKKLSYLRYGEFHRIENDRAVESYIYLDIPELMISCNQWPLDMGSRTLARLHRNDPRTCITRRFSNRSLRP